MILIKKDIERLEDRYRRTFINSLAGFRQVVLIGTKSKEGKSNLAIFNSLIHLGANPALFGFITRPDTAQRDTLTNILETRKYTLNYISKEYLVAAHQTSARYDSNVSEFDAVGFEEAYLENFYAPFVAQAPIKIAMNFEEKVDIKLNGTALIVGSIETIQLDEQLVEVDGYINLDSKNIIVSCGLDAYFKTERIARLSYAKPDIIPTVI